MYTQKEQEFAEEVANALNDRASLPFHLANAKKYSHKTLRDTLQHVLSVPEHEIRISRAALYTSIVRTLPYDK